MYGFISVSFSVNEFKNASLSNVFPENFSEKPFFLAFCVI